MVVLPWERYVWTPEFKQDYNQGRIKQEGLDKVYLKYGAELDDIFIARHKDSNFPSLSEDILSGGLGPSSCPPIAPPQQKDRWIVVSGRPENHRDSIEHWLLMHNIALDKLLLRDDLRFSIKAGDDPYEKAEIAAKSKAAHIRAEGITHFYEPDLLQTSFIAALVL